MPVYQTFVVNSTTDSAVIDFRYPYNYEPHKFNYKLVMKSVDMQFSYQNVVSGNNTVTINYAPLTVTPQVIVIPPGAYDISTMKIFWNAQNWYGGGCSLGFDSATNRVGLIINAGTSITLSAGIANLFGSVQGTITNSTASPITYSCTNAPQFANFNAVIARCSSVYSGSISATASVILNAVAIISLANANPGEYLHWYQEYAKEEYNLSNPSFTLTLASDQGAKLVLDSKLYTTVCFVIIVSEN